MCESVEQSPHNWGGLFRFSLPLLFFQDFLFLYLRAFCRVIIQLFFFKTGSHYVALLAWNSIMMKTRLALNS